MYKIIYTSDGKFRGRLLPQEPAIDSIIQLDSFEFEVVTLKRTSSRIIISNSNYIIHLVKE